MATGVFENFNHTVNERKIEVVYNSKGKAISEKKNCPWDLLYFDIIFPLDATCLPQPNKTFQKLKTMLDSNSKHSIGLIRKLSKYASRILTENFKFHKKLRSLPLKNSRRKIKMTKCEKCVLYIFLFDNKILMKLSLVQFQVYEKCRLKDRTASVLQTGSPFLLSKCWLLWRLKSLTPEVNAQLIDRVLLYWNDSFTWTCSSKTLRKWDISRKSNLFHTQIDWF